MSLKHVFFTSILISFLPYASAEIVVNDYLGREVRLEKPARKIIALAPHIVENLYSAGAGEFIVGAVDYCDYPEQAKLIPRVGAISAYSLEAIVALDPDLVVVWRTGRGGKIMEKLIKLGFSVYASNPHSLEEVSKSIRDFGILAGTEKVAEQTAKRFDEKHKKLKQQYSQRSVVRTFYQVWNDPLQTLNGENAISDVIRLCGGENVFEDAIAIAPKVGVESILKEDPEIIIASGMGEQRPDWLEMWKKWPQLTAVQQGNLEFIPPDYIQRHTERMLVGATLMCEHLELARSRRK